MTKEEAEAALAAKQAEQAAKDLSAYRAWVEAKRVSNVRAAHILEADPAAVFRGKEIDGKQGPDAA